MGAAAHATLASGQWQGGKGRMTTAISRHTGAGTSAAKTDRRKHKVEGKSRSRESELQQKISCYARAKRNTCTPAARLSLTLIWVGWVVQSIKIPPSISDGESRKAATCSRCKQAWHFLHKMSRPRVLSRSPEVRWFASIVCRCRRRHHHRSRGGAMRKRLRAPRRRQPADARMRPSWDLSQKGQVTRGTAEKRCRRTRPGCIQRCTHRPRLGCHHRMSPAQDHW